MVCVGARARGAGLYACGAGSLPRRAGWALGGRTGAAGGGGAGLPLRGVSRRWCAGALGGRPHAGAAVLWAGAGTDRADRPVRLGRFAADAGPCGAGHFAREDAKAGSRFADVGGRSAGSGAGGAGHRAAGSTRGANGTGRVRLSAHGVFRRLGRSRLYPHALGIVGGA